MYSFGLVKRKRRRRIAAIFAIVGAIGTSVFAIVAFLGRSVGTFTINLKSDGVALSMDTHKAFDNPTTYLSASGFDKISGPYSYPWFSSIGFENIHNENTTFELGRDAYESGIRFFKYTFYIKNIGTIHANFDMEVILNENIKPKNQAQPLDQYLRLMVFEDERDPIIYAQRSLTLDPGPENDYREYVASGPDGARDGKYFGKAELFSSEDSLATIKNTLEPEQVKKFTLVFWLEGEDPECDKIPDDASLRIGATINAYPQQNQGN
jgi:hypothetical protein